jgi:hypothetical protein
VVDFPNALRIVRRRSSTLPSRSGSVRVRHRRPQAVIRRGRSTRWPALESPCHRPRAGGRGDSAPHSKSVSALDRHDQELAGSAAPLLRADRVLAFDPFDSPPRTASRSRTTLGPSWWRGPRQGSSARHRLDSLGRTSVHERPTWSATAYFGTLPNWLSEGSRSTRARSSSGRTVARSGWARRPPGRSGLDATPPHPLRPARLERNPTEPRAQVRLLLHLSATLVRERPPCCESFCSSSPAASPPRRPSPRPSPRRTTRLDYALSTTDQPAGGEHLRRRTRARPHGPPPRRGGVGGDERRGQPAPGAKGRNERTWRRCAVAAVTPSTWRPLNPAPLLLNRASPTTRATLGGACGSPSRPPRQRDRWALLLRQARPGTRRRERHSGLRGVLERTARPVGWSAAGSCRERARPGGARRGASRGPGRSVSALSHDSEPWPWRPLERRPEGARGPAARGGPDYSRHPWRDESSGSRSASPACGTTGEPPAPAGPHPGERARATIRVS